MTKILLSIFISFSASLVYSQFTEVSGAYGIFIIQEGTVWGNGASFFDFNHDGWDDLTTADGSDAIRFFINTNGSLLPAPFSIDFTFSGQIIGVVWFDYDNDGDEDLLVSQWGGRLLLFQNNGTFNFTEIGSQAGLPMIAYNHFGLACADVDQDGFLDFAVAKYYNPDNQTSLLFSTRFFHNNGNGTFTDNTDNIGLTNGPLPTFQPVFLDVNEDGWLDMYLVVDRYQFPNRVYLNNGNGTFSLNQQFGLNVAIDAMSATMGDYDNDLDVDIFVSNTPPGNFLLKNNEGVFMNVASEAGVAVNQVCWGSNWLDYDNDGFQDLFVGNTNLAFNAVANRWFVNNHDGTFTNTPSLFGKLNDMDPTFCSVMGDVNNDGYYDYYNNNNDPRPCRFWLNDGGDNNYLSLSFEGSISNKNAFGTKVIIYAGDNAYVRHTHCGESYIAQNSSKEIFGLNDISSVDSLVITWPRGLVERYYNLDVNQHIHYIEGQSFLSTFQILANDSTLCPGQTITLDAGIGASWSWNTGASTRIIEVNEPGVYSCSVSHGFDFIQHSIPFQLEVQTPPMPIESVVNISCFEKNDGSIDIVIDYPEITEITWSDGTVEWSRDSLIAGEYSFNIISENGCVYSDTILVSQPTDIAVSFVTLDVTCNGLQDGTIQIDEITGGTPVYITNYDQQSQLDAGTYFLEIIDANGCSKSFPFEITQPDPLTIDVDVISNDTPENIGASVVAMGGVFPYSFALNGSVIDDSTFYNLPEGSYALEVFDGNNCSVLVNFDLVAEVIIDATNELDIDDCWQWLSRTEIAIKCASPSQPVRIYNSSGQLMYISKTKEPIRMNEWAPGIYYFSFENMVGKFAISP
jgi:hypothetical protein